MKTYFKQCSRQNYLPANRQPEEITYLVIHYTANNGDTAKNNADYFARESVSASAHYFVDEHEVWQSVRDKDIAWHCGTRGTYFHSYCRNANSISIEICSRFGNGAYYFREEAIANAVELARELMKKYDIPVYRVVRHYDVTHKNCPAPFVEHADAWEKFKRQLAGVPAVFEKEDNEMTAEQVQKLIAESRTVYKTVSDVPEWGRQTVEKLIKREWLQGKNAEGELNLSDDLLRALVINDRAGLYGE